MEASHIDGRGWPTPPGADSSRHAQHLLSRRGFIGGAAAATAMASAGSALAWPSVASAAPFSVPPPRPTSAITPVNGVDFHLSFFGPGIDPSSITDFKGVVGVADVQGNGTATNPDGSTETLLFDTDVRFMQGTYIGLDGDVHEATFGFI